jgi:hypothetical protein
MQMEEVDRQHNGDRIEAETTVIAVTSNKHRKPESRTQHRDIIVARAISQDKLSKSSSIIAPVQTYHSKDGPRLRTCRCSRLEKAMSFNRIAIMKVSNDLMRIPSETETEWHVMERFDAAGGRADFQVSQILTGARSM